MSINHWHSSSIHCCGDAYDERTDGLYDAHPQGASIKKPQQIGSSNGIAIHGTRYFFPHSTEVSYATGGELRRKQGPVRPLGVFQDPDATLGGTGRDHVQSLPLHTEGSHKDLVQQADAQLH